jgi:glycine betaine/choline ABC-type transport system substrate-binding protein
VNDSVELAFHGGAQASYAPQENVMRLPLAALFAATTMALLGTVPAAAQTKTVVVGGKNFTEQLLLGR